MFKRYLLFRFIQVIVDFLLVYGAFLLTYFWRVEWVFSTDFVFQTFAVFSFLATGVWIGFLLLSKYYRIPPRSGVRTWFDIFLVVIGAALASSFLIVVYFFSREELFSRWISLVSFVAGVFLLLFSRWFFLVLLKRAKQRKVGCYRTLIVGGNRIAEQLIHALETNPYALHDVVGVIEPYGIYKQVKGTEVLGKLNKLEEVCDQKHVTAIIQCDAFEHTLSLISFCEERDIKFEFDPALRGVFEKNLRIRETAGVNLISFVKRDYEDKKKQGFYRIGDFVLRQVFDVD